MGENNSRNIIEVHLQPFTIVEQAFGENATGTNSNGSESRRSGHITDGVNPVLAGVLISIDSDIASFVSLDTGLIQVKVVRVRRSANS